MSITIRGNTKINSRTTVGNYGITPIPPSQTPTPTPTQTPTSGTFLFTFNQQYASSNLTIDSIGGFTSTPSFTPTTNAFTFNSTGSPLGTTTFSFTGTAGGLSTTLTNELTQNDVVIQSFSVQNAFTFIVDFTPIVVSQSDTIQIRTYFAD